MSSLFIAGNGFDIAHGIPTKYSDFRAFIIKKYPEALKYRDEIIYLEDCDYIEIEEFAAEILLSTMDKVSGENWNNFEEALAYILILVINCQDQIIKIMKQRKKIIRL